jgi:hypothetical protein
MFLRVAGYEVHGCRDYIKRVNRRRLPVVTKADDGYEILIYKLLIIISKSGDTRDEYKAFSGHGGSLGSNQGVHGE